ncbi:MAG TPA: phosphatidylglycerol lysyltransferase domain-containing protein, partial [Candidatus Saccharimonadales bacterium]|nr:phosphatidylglycerol lysyltransferase domain-containing protein [Candidatus Saccharimonadales bacterium]
SAGLEPMQIGSSAIIDIEQFLDETIKDKWWRWRINKAEKNGYEYEAARPPHSQVLLKEMRQVSDIWLSSGGRAERGFALGRFDKDYLQSCVIHTLRDKTGRLIAFSNQLPQFRPDDLLTVDLLRSDPQTESMAYLLYKVIEAGQVTGRSKFDLGFVPFARASGPLLAIAKTVSSDRFSAKGLEQFKNKFNPNWQPNYLAYDGDMADLGVIALNIEKVMAVSPDAN